MVFSELKGSSIKLTLEKSSQTVSKINNDVDLENANKLANAIAPAINDNLEKVSLIQSYVLIGE